MDTTILIKTFERPDAVARLMASVRQYYPEIPVVIIDDGKDSMLKDTFSAPNIDFIKTDYDIGLSAGRNLGLTHVQTPYVFICDDDCVFTEKTDLAKAESLLMGDDVDILGIDAGVGYCGQFKTNGDTVEYIRGKYHGIGFDVDRYDFVPNIFLARTDAVKEYKWDEELKMGEHFAYFYDHLGKLRVGFTTAVSMKHEHIHNPNYDPMRGRASDFVKQYMRKKGIKRRVTFDGVDEV